MSDQHEQNPLDRIEQSLRLDETAGARESEAGGVSGARRLLTIAGKVGLYIVAGVLLVIGFVTVNIVLLVVGLVVLIPAACIHVIGWIRRRRADSP